MRIIIKPMGAIVLLLAILLLSGLAFLRNKGGDSAAASTGVKAEATTAPPIAAGGSKDGLVYDDGMHGGWETYGWTKELDWGESAHARGGKGVCIRAVLKPFEGVYMHHKPPMDITPYDRLTFYLNGGERGGQSLTLIAILGEDKRVTFDLTPPSANQWKPYTISLKAMGIDGAKNLSGFWIWSSQAQPVLYMDDVRFLKPGEPDPAVAAQ